jgi:uncharacterized protein YbaR (Trm112 family)
MSQIDPAFLAILRCPETGRALRPAVRNELDVLNARIRRGGVRNRAGQPVAGPVEAGLVPEGDSVLYPIVQDIPILLTKEAIPLRDEAEGPPDAVAPRQRAN